MGYATIAYGVDLDRLRAVRGSRDVALLAELETKFADRLLAAEETNASLYHLPLELCDALRQIMAGEIAEESDKAAAQYVYAYELLCEHFGRPLDGRNHIEFLDDLGWDTAALLFRTPIDLPSPGSLPLTGYLTADEVRSEHERFKDCDSDDNEPRLTNAREEFVWWLKQCVSERLALVTFCY